MVMTDSCMRKVSNGFNGTTSWAGLSGKICTTFYFLLVLKEAFRTRIELFSLGSCLVIGSQCKKLICHGIDVF